jgi:hypothetical protein
MTGPSFHATQKIDKNFFAIKIVAFACHIPNRQVKEK